MLFLQDYNLIWRMEQGVNMGPANALPQKDKVNTTNNNNMVTMLPRDDV